MAGVFGRGIGVNSPLNQMLRQQFLTPQQFQQIEEQEVAQRGGGLLSLLLGGTAAATSVAAANAGSVPNASQQVTDPGALAGGPVGGVAPATAPIGGTPVGIAPATPAVTTPIPAASPVARRSNEGSFFDRFLSPARQGSVGAAFREGIFGRGRARREVQAEELAIAAARTQIEGTQALIRQRDAAARKALADARRTGRTAQSPAGKLRADQEAEIITKETADAGIAKINEIGESSFDQKVEALVGTGLDRDTATNIVSGRFVSSRDPITGNAQVVDKATGNVVGGATPEAAAAIEAEASGVPPLNVLDLATGPIDTTAAALSAIPVIGDIAEEIGFGGLDQRRAKVFVESLNKDIEIAFANNPRFAEGEMKRLRSLRLASGFFTRDSSSFADALQLRSEMSNRLINETRIANDPTMSPEVVKTAQRAVAHLPGIINKVDKMIAVSRFSVGGKPIPTMNQQDLDAVDISEMTPDQLKMLAAQQERLSGQ